MSLLVWIHERQKCSLKCTCVGFVNLLIARKEDGFITTFHLSFSVSPVNKCAPDEMPFSPPSTMSPIEVQALGNSFLTCQSLSPPCKWISLITNDSLPDDDPASFFLTVGNCNMTTSFTLLAFDGTSFKIYCCCSFNSIKVEVLFNLFFCQFYRAILNRFPQAVSLVLCSSQCANHRVISQESPGLLWHWF